MKLTPVYVITDADGQAELEVEGTLEETVDAGLSEYGRDAELVYAGDLSQLKQEQRHDRTEQERLPNPPKPTDFWTTQAMRALGPNFWTEDAGVPRPRTYSRAEVERDYPLTDDGLRAAWEALRPYFPQKGQFSRVIRSGPRAGETLLIGDTYETPAGMSKALLVANAKTVKAAKGLEQSDDVSALDVTVNSAIPPSLSKGLAFLPHSLAKDTEFYPQWGGVPGLKDSVGVCFGSSAACRKSCLVFAGQNQAVEHNNIIKGDRLIALLREPKAFIRMLVDSLHRHAHATEQSGSVAYFRPNILSDIPWEILFPELWTYAPLSRMSVYDYTKLGGRKTEFLGTMRGPGVDKMLDGAARYDLTFSFSGTNAPTMQAELDRGMRVAVVFLRTLKSGSLKPNKRGKVTYKAAESFHNVRFMGQPVIDGDIHDLRPLDKQGTVVGLRFKSLRGKGQGTRAEQLEKAEDFVVGAKGGLPRAASKERAHLRVAQKKIKWIVEAYDDGHGNIIAPGTPLQEGVSISSMYGSSAAE